MPDIQRLKRFHADWVCPVSRPPIPGGEIAIANGRIETVGPSQTVEESTETFPGCAIIPGFVNAHTHLELTLLRGLVENLTFVDWIRKLTRVKYEHMTRDDLTLSARLGAMECLAAGVTTVGEVMDVGTGWEAMVEFGLRGIAYQEVFGPSREAANQSLGDLMEKVNAYPRPDVSAVRRIGVSPHAPYTVSAPLYEKVRTFAERESLPIAIHIGESSEEGQFVRTGTGPFADHWVRRGIPVEPRHMGPIAYVADRGILSSRTLAIHAIDASPEEIRLLRNADVAIAHCPKSNLKLGHGIAPLREFLDAGLRVGLGTDSVASNNVVDMFEEMRMAVFMQRTRLGMPLGMTATEALHMATLGGARCLGLDSEVGSLDVGKLADFVVVDLADLAVQPVYDPVEAMVFSANRSNVDHTFLAGERVDTIVGDVPVRARDVAARLAGTIGTD